MYVCVVAYVCVYTSGSMHTCARHACVCVRTSAQLEVYCGMISEICIDCVATYFPAYLGKLSDPASRAYAVYGLRFRVWGS